MILLASSSKEYLIRWEQVLRGLAPVFCATDLDSVRGEMVRINPHILLLDYDLPRLDGTSGISGLMKLSPETRVIILSVIISDEFEWILFEMGIRGYCRSDIESSQLKTVVHSVQQGELWIRRALSSRLLKKEGLRKFLKVVS
ncbi:MAG: hypothetical protein ABJA60_02015 [Nitrosospira sp.]